MIIGLISDTHSLVRPEVFDALNGVELILHAGDVGGGGVLDELGASRRFAPYMATSISPGTRISRPPSI